MTAPLQPDTSLYGPPRALSSPDTSLYGPPRAMSSDASRMAGSSGKGKMTWEQAIRAAAAGVLPGISDNVIGFLRAAATKGKPFAEAYAEASADERRVLDEARTMAGSGWIENLSALVGGAGLTKLATKGVPGVSKVADFLVGGVGKSGAPSSVLGGMGAGAKAGARVGAIAGAGNADEGGVVDRLFGAASGAVGGGVVGGTLGGAITFGGNKLFPAQLNQADAAQVFPLGTPVKAQRKVVGELSDAVERGGVAIPAARAQAETMRGAGIDPLLADVGGPSMLGDLRLTDQMSQTRGAGASNIFKERLGTRALGRSERRAEAVATATGRPTESFPDYVEKLKAQKRALDDIMFTRFRQAAAANGPTRAGRLRTPDQLKKTLMDPKFFNAAVKLEEEMASNQAAGVAGRYISPFKPVLDGDGVPTGEFEVKDFLDPVTLAELSRVLGGMREEAYAAAGNARLARAPAAAKQTIDDLLSTIPEFKEANALSKHMHARIEAAELGAKRGVSGRRGAVEADRAKYNKSAPPIPADVRKFLASEEAPEILRGRSSFGSAWEDYQAGAQSQRVDLVEAGKNPAAMRPVAAPAKEARVFGDEAAARLRASEDAEAIAAGTEAMSPSAQGRVAPQSGATAQQRLAETGTAATKYALRFGGGPVGFGLGAVDALGRAARYGLPPSPTRLTGIAQGMTGPAGPALNLIDQIRAASNTPMRRGLLGGSGYMAGGLLGDNWNDR